MRANPRLLRGHNKLWIRFFLLAVFATMYVRDHNRPADACRIRDGSDANTISTVFRITSEISTQVFPLSLDLDNPAFRAGLERLRRIAAAVEAARAQGGAIGMLRRCGLGIAAAAVFARLYLLPVHHHELPAQIRMVPAW